MHPRPLKITVVGAGPVGLANAVLLARRHEVVVLDTDPACVARLNERRSPVPEAALQHALANEHLDLRSTLDAAEAYAGARLVVVCVPTPADPSTGGITTAVVEHVIAQARRLAPAANLVIRSTLPIGCTAALCERHGHAAIVHAPEFLREGHALHDAQYPSRIVAGPDSPAAREWVDLMREAIGGGHDAPVMVMGDREAEAVKLMANTLLAARVALFNELDTLAAGHGLAAGEVWRGLGRDPRIGEHYNKPSFGFGGPCLPRDVAQLARTEGASSLVLVQSLAASNEARIGFVVREILQRRPRVVGLYRLGMKEGSVNLVGSASLRVLRGLQAGGVQVIAYEPSITAPAVQGCPLASDLAAFKAQADLIVADRVTQELADVQGRVYTRDQSTLP